MNKSAPIKEMTSKRKTPMSVVIRGIPKGCNWGWFSREDPRMHLQSVDNKHGYKVWLENKGKRVFEVVGKIPADVQKALKQELGKQRRFIEDRWVRLMLDNHWLQLYVSLPHVTLIAYPSYGHRIVRVLDLDNEFSANQLATLRSENIELNREMASLRLWCDRAEEDEPYDWRLSSILWQD